jgi:4-amino-4-deoxy-L-arabinose transferase-like glycosyltransferase
MAQGERADFNGEGLASRIFWTMVLLGAGSFILLAVYSYQSHIGLINILSAETIFSAETAKCLCRGEGFSTGYITPLGLSYVPDAVNHPSLFNAPLYPIVLVPFFKIFGIGNKAVIICAVILYLLEIVLLFWATDRLYGTKAALLVSLFFTANPLAVGYTLAGGMHMMTVLTFSLLFTALYWSEDKGIAGSAVIGLMFGLCYLSSPACLILCIPVIGYLWMCRALDKGRHVMAFIIGFLMTAGWWLLRDGIVTGNPLWGARWLLGISMPDNLKNYGIAAAARKVGAAESISKFLNSVIGLLTVWGNSMGALFFASLVLSPPGNRFKRIRYFGYTAIITCCLLVGWNRRIIASECFVPFLPFVCMLAGMALVTLARGFESHDRKVYAIYGCIVALFLLPIATMYSVIVEPHGGVKGGWAEDYERLGLTSKDVFVFDLAMFLSWYGDKKAIEMPVSIGDYQGMIKAVKGIKGIRFSSEFKDAAAADSVGDWKSVYDQLLEGIMPPQLAMKQGVIMWGSDIYLYN